MIIGFIGGTGVEGKGLALRFARAGAEVLLGSRSREKAAFTAAEYNAILGTASVCGIENPEMLARAEIVFLTVPWDQATSAVEQLRESFRAGQVLVDVTVPVRFLSGRPSYVELAEGSNAERIAGQVPAGIDLVAAFKTEPAHVLADLDTPLDCDVFVCSDSPAAREKVIETARIIPDIRPVDAGPLSMARTLERMTVLAIHLNRRYRSKGARYFIRGI